MRCLRAEAGRAVAGLKVGSGLEEGVTQGPLIDGAGLAKVEELLADAVAKGARVLCGGKRHARGGPSSSRP
jgi:succinate-semialdehyde dehydrogenase/glutarate-semialdehyde dehydrogenase